MEKYVRTVLLLISSAVILTSCRQPEPPVTPPVETPQPPPVETPKTFPATEISGTLLNWPGGEAFVTLTGGYSETSTGDPDVGGVELVAPLYQGPVSSDGTFRVELSDPDPATLVPLGCNASDPEIAFLGVAVASNVPTPTQGSEVLGYYSNGDPQTLGRRGGWLYVAEAYDAEASCEAASQSGLDSIDLTLAPGWNQVVYSFTEAGANLTSSAVPDAFIWGDFF